MDFVDGVQAAGSVDKVLDLRRAKIGNAASLTELAADFVFYTAAPQLIYCPVPEDPLVALTKELGRRVESCLLKFDRPVFRGFPFEFDHAVWCLEREAWDKFANLLKGITCVDRQRRILFQLRLRELTVADPLELQRRGFSSGLAVKVWAVCVETNLGCYYVDDSAGLQTPPVFRYTPDTFPDFIILAERLLGPA